MANKPKRIYEKCLTPRFRAAFANVYQAKAINPGDAPVFSMVLLFDKEAQNSEEYKTMKATAQTAAKQMWPNGLPANFHNPFQDPVKAGKTNLAGYDEGVVFVNTKTKDRPGIINLQGRELIDKNEFASGDYARATITFSPYEYMGKTGLTVYLNNIQMLEQGERFSGRASATDDFSVDTSFEANDDFGSNEDFPSEGGGDDFGM